MDWKLFATIFSTVFLAELGDKTRVATMLFSADKPASKWIVLAASASALRVAAAIGVIAGRWIGAWTVRSAYV